MLDFSERQHALDHFAKDDVLAIQEVALCCRDKELLSREKAGSIESVHLRGVF